MKVQGQKGKCKDDIKSYSLDRFEQVERSKIHLQTKIVFSHSYVNADHTVQLGFFFTNSTIISFEHDVDF